MPSVGELRAPHPRAIRRANLDVRPWVHNERTPPARLASRIPGPHAGVCAGVCARVNLPLLLLLLSRPVAEIVLLDRRLVVTLGVVQPRAIGRTKKEHKIVLLCLQILCLPIQVASCTDVARHVRPAEMSAAPSALSDRSTHQPTGNTACLMIQHARNGGNRNGIFCNDFLRPGGSNTKPQSVFLEQYSKARPGSPLQFGWGCPDGDNTFGDEGAGTSTSSSHAEPA